jgi:adenosylhomocysteinase
MDGYRVMPIAEAAHIGDIFITTTGDKSVIDEGELQQMKDGAILANSGHFDVEINLKAIHRLAVARRIIRPFIEEFSLPNGRNIYVLGEGRLINLAAADVMDMSFANQALSASYVVRNRGQLPNSVHVVPLDIDREVARLKLEAMGFRIDTLTREQEVYLSSWQSGT